jgi:hypothetical protein
MVNKEKLRDAFKYYWMDDETQFCIYPLIACHKLTLRNL